MPVSAPPDVPAGVNAETAAYLRRLRTWAYQELQRTIRRDEATAHLVLAAYDVKMNPKIFAVQVSNSGALVANELPLGEGKP